MDQFTGRQKNLNVLACRRTEIPEQNLLPATKARQILREFFETGIRSINPDWEAF